MKSILKKYGLYFIIVLIACLLLANIYLIDHNNFIIQENKSLQEDTEKIKIHTAEIIRVIHFLDMTLRGYALLSDPSVTKIPNNPTYLKDLNNTLRGRNETYSFLEMMLKKQHYPMKSFYEMRDSIDGYIKLIRTMKSHIDQGRKDKFLKMLSEDNGYRAWAVYNNFLQQVNVFENNIHAQTQRKYDNALTNSYTLQVLLFFIIVPTLGYTAYYTRKTMLLTDQLRLSEANRNQILENQNSMLERGVMERTNEIQLMNEEITSHNEQLILQQDQIAKQNVIVTSQNRDLQQAQKIIEDQNKLISAKNEELTMEVDRRTQDLQKTNLELIEHNNRLEQFTFIISHNLRAPITRLVGLSNILNFARDENDQKSIVKMIVKSTLELDEVIADLNKILAIQKLSMQVYSEVILVDLVDKVKRILATEMEETQCKLLTDLAEVKTITTLPQYIESIFYNLISNALKYRHPDRTPVINISAIQEDDRVRIQIADNGIGIDVESNKQHLFNLYKRFHFHVEGKGLGLYLVKTQVIALGGTIDLQSEPNKGSIFTILLYS